MDKLPAPPALAAVFRLWHLTEPLLRRAPAEFADAEKDDRAREALGAVKAVKGITRMKRATRVSRAAQQRAK
jgi:hypothetical protein